jgi:hypothetical protein
MGKRTDASLALKVRLLTRDWGQFGFRNNNRGAPEAQHLDTISPMAPLFWETQKVIKDASHEGRH